MHPGNGRRDSKPLKAGTFAGHGLIPVVRVQQNNTFRRAWQKKQQLCLPAQPESG
jgi:hypothetical protein